MVRLRVSELGPEVTELGLAVRLRVSESGRGEWAKMRD